MRSKVLARLRHEEGRDSKRQVAMLRQRLTELMMPLELLGKMQLRRAKRKRATKKRKAAASNLEQTSVTGTRRTLTRQVRLQDQASTKTLQTRWSRTSTSSLASTQSMTPATQTRTKAS